MADKSDAFERVLRGCFLIIRAPLSRPVGMIATKDCSDMF